MQKKFILSYLLIFFTLLLIMSLSRPMADKTRGGMASALAPLWGGLNEIKYFFIRSQSTDLAFKQSNGSVFSSQEEIKRLQLENQLLLNQLNVFTTLLDNRPFLNESLNSQAEEDSRQRDKQQAEKQLTYTSEAIPARVIFRSLDTWNQALWINVGEANNSDANQPTIAKNSPVLFGDSIIGVIDYVGHRQSRVRLITDPALTPSVRASRGGEQESLMADRIDFILHGLSQKKQASLSLEEQDTLENLLKIVKSSLRPFKKSWRLAKGELQGHLNSLTRQDHLTLKGVGFNYDFSDEEGEARDLRTGKLMNQSNSAPISILKLNDLLITTGMDGVFPAGLKVAIVKKINPLKEGDFYYELEAEPTAGNLNELSLVFVIPPLGYDKEDLK